MIAKPAMLECKRCGKIFIGWKTDPPPKGGPACLKCKARRAWEDLTSAIEPKKGRGAKPTKRTPARKPAKRSVARRTVGKRSAAKAAR
jgi:hypothetical protein